MSHIDELPEVPQHPHIKALREKHEKLSEKIDKALQGGSLSDLQITNLKKEKLLVKEKIVLEERKRQS